MYVYVYVYMYVSIYLYKNILVRVTEHTDLFDVPTGGRIRCYE